MATLSKGYNFASGETNITATKLNNLVDNASISNIVGADLANGAVDLAGAKITGILPKANGGTGINASSVTDLFNQLDPLTTKGDVVAHDGSNSVRVPIGTNGHILTADSTVAAGLKWAAAPSSGSNVAVSDEGTQLTAAASSINFVGAGVTATNSGADVTVTVPGGGSSSPTTIKGDLIVRDASADQRLPVGTDTFVLTADSSQALGVKWASAVSGTSALTFNKFQVFDSSGTWSNPDKVTKVYAQVWGAGGSGGSSANTTGNSTPSATGGGGGSGGYTAGIVSITPDPQTVTVSGSSTFAGLTANQGSTGGSQGGAGGAGGTASGGTVIINGAAGCGGAAVGSGIGGMGGSAGMGGGGGGGGGGSGGAATNGSEGQTPGGGGGGAGGGNGVVNGRSGGAGGGGRIIIWWNEPTVGTGIDNLEAGTVVPYAGSTAPTNWLLCDGSAVSRSTYAVLFAVLGTTFGSGDGSTTFNVPDLRGRVPAGKDNMGGTAANRITTGGSGISGTTLGATGGEETHQLTISEMPSHTHGITTGGASVTAGNVQKNNGSDASASTQSTGGNAPHQNVQPSLILNYIIKYTSGGSSGGTSASVSKKSKNASIGGSLTSILPVIPSGKSFRINKMILVNDTTSAATFDLEINDGTNGAILLEDDYTLGPRSRIEYDNIVIPNNGTTGTIRMSSTQTLNAFINYDEGSNSSLKSVAVTVGTSLTTIIPTVAAGKVIRIPKLYIHNPTTADNNFNLKLLDATGGLELELADGTILGPKSTIVFENLSISEGGYLKAIMPSLTCVAVCGYEEVLA